MKMVLKSKPSWIYLEFDEFDIFKILYLKSTFWQIGPKFKTLPDLLENVHSLNLECVECISNMDILRYFTKILNLYKLVLKLKSRWVCLKFVYEPIFKGAYNESDIIILILFI